MAARNMFSTKQKHIIRCFNSSEYTDDAGVVSCHRRPEGKLRYVFTDYYQALYGQRFNLKKI